MFFLSSLVLGAWLAVTTTQAIPTIEAVGNKFFDSDGTQFFIRGVAYQLTPADPLMDTEQCQRDAELMKTLGVNTVRVYHVDPDADHDGCMDALAEAGIYAMVDMDTFNTYILPNDPWWNQTQLDAYSKVMDTFQGYDNLLGLYVGNEIIAMNNQSEAAPFIKASSRDLKAYRDSKGYRKIPIGYSATDIAELRPMLQEYLTCGGNASENVDFFGLNSYQWCDPTSYEVSGYSNLQDQAKDFPVPIFFSETGCNTPGPRLFEDQAAIFGSQMSSDWSGAIIYEWIEEANEYGLISYGPEVAATATGSDIEGGYSRRGTPTPVSPDFYNLKTQWAAVTPTGVARSNYNAADVVSTRECPSSTEGGWLVNGNIELPTLGATLTKSSSTTGAPQETGSGGDSDSDESSNDDEENSVPGSKQVAGMAAALAGVLLGVTLWL